VDNRVRFDMKVILEDRLAAAATMYLIEGPLETPSGRKPRVRIIWLIETGQVAPRFITAYPLAA
jgi:hypothetical protein